MNNAVMPDQPVYSHSLKISDTSKGIRIDVHVWAHSTGAAIEECFNMYLKAQQTARDNKIPLAPVDKQ